MKIVFPYDGFEHLGIGYLAAVAMAAGHQVILVPLTIGDYISGYHQAGDRQTLQARDLLLSQIPDIVAFSLTSPMAGSMIRIAQEVRKAGLKTIAGGPHASAEPEITLRSGAFDALLEGEAEEVFVAALEATCAAKPNQLPWLHTPHRQATRVPPRPDLNLLPMPAKALFYRNYPYQAKDYLIISSRGCPYSCAFCAGAHRHGNARYRQRSNDSLLAELTWAKEKFKPESIYFLDDIFTLNRKWLKEFLKVYRRDISLPFHAISHPLHLDGERAVLLREAGCIALRLGVQTLTPRTRQRLNRPEETHDVIRAIKAVKEAGIRVEVDHMLDLPGETLDNTRQAVEFYNHHRPDAIKVYWLMPLPGSRWFEEAQQEGRLSPEMANKMRQGEGFGSHSYLFSQKGYSNRCWLGIHLLLAYLPHLPRWLVTMLLRYKADRFLRIPSFAITVGLSRLLIILKGWDQVGKGHLRKLSPKLFQGKMRGTGPNA